MEALSEKEGYLQKDLAARCHVEPATMTIILTNMEKMGYIRRETAHVSGGKRALPCISPTPEGKLPLWSRKLCAMLNKSVSKDFLKRKNAAFGLSKRLGDNLAATLNK